MLCLVAVSFCLSLLQSCHGDAAQDMATIRQRIFNVFAPSNSDNARTKMPSLMSKFNTSTGAFTDTDYTNNYRKRSDPFKKHADRTYMMAKAYWQDRSDNPYFKKDEHARNIELSLHYLAYTAPPNEDPSWWNKKIEITSKLLAPMFLARPFINMTFIEKLYGVYWLSVDEWSIDDTTENMAGGNFAIRGKLGLWGALAVSDKEFLRLYKEFKNILTKELIYKEGYNGAGMQHDYCLHQHNYKVDGKVIHQEYNGCYNGILSDVASIAGFLKDTSFALEPVALRNLVDGLLECHQWFMWNQASEPTISGRKMAMSRATTYFTARKTRNIANQMKQFGYRVDELQKAINRFGKAHPSMNDALVGNRAFYNSAMMSHRRYDFMCALRMISDTVIRPESWASIGIHNTDLNSFGYYEGDGFTTCIQHGGEVGKQRAEIYKFYDYEKIPGTTILQKGTIPAISTGKSKRFHALNIASFVGGVSDYYYGASAMEFNRGPLPFTAKKMWAFFDLEMVAVGCDILPKEGEVLEGPLYTTLNQIQHIGDVHIKDSNGNVQVVSADGLVDLAEPPMWVYHDHIAYLPIPQDDAVPKWSAGIQRRKAGKKYKNLFLAYMDHGIPTAEAPASYAYIVRMDIDLDEIDDYTNSISENLVVSNTPQVQVVIHKEIRVGYAIFYEPASAVSDFMDITADQPCMVLYKEAGEYDVSIAVSNPGLPGLTVTLDVGKVLVGPNATPNGIRTKVVFTFPDDDAVAGKSIIQTYTIGEQSTEEVDETEPSPQSATTKAPPRKHSGKNAKKS